MSESVSRLEEPTAARVELQAAIEREERYSGNNPNEHRTAVRLAREKVDIPSEALKRAGLIPMTVTERLGFELERLHPHANHGETVEHAGKSCRHSIVPRTHTLSGRVGTWTKIWDGVEGEA